MLTGDLLRRSAARFGSKPAMVWGDDRVDYRTLDARANAFAHALIGAGLGRGARIAILSANRPHYGVVYFGAARSGTVLAHLSHRMTEAEMVHVLGRIGANALFAETTFFDRARALAAQLDGLRIVALPGEGAAEGHETLDAFVTGRPATEPAVAIAEDDPYAVTFTGGTTGFPKAVLVSHRGRVASTLGAMVEFGVDERDVVACVTPLFHTAGLYVWYQMAIALGCTCVMLPTWDVGMFRDAVAREGVTAAFFVPTQLNALAADPGFDPEVYRGLRKVNFAGAPMPAALFQRLRAELPWVEFTEHYGQSEACPIAVRRPWANDAHADSVGRAVFNMDVAVLGPDGAPLPPGEIGEIATRGDGVLAEYLGDPEQTAALWRAGWIVTGDVGTLDDEGWLRIVDRSKDMIIAGGENIYPAEIENALYRHPAVAECAVFGIPDEHWGEVPAAHVVLNDGFEVTPEALIDHCARTVARHKRPRLVELVDSLPKSPVGKILKTEIKAPYWEGEKAAV